MATAATTTMITKVMTRTTTTTAIGNTITTTPVPPVTTSTIRLISDAITTTISRPRAATSSKPSKFLAPTTTSRYVEIDDAVASIGVSTSSAVAIVDEGFAVASVTSTTRRHSGRIDLDQDRLIDGSMHEVTHSAHTTSSAPMTDNARSFASHQAVKHPEKIDSEKIDSHNSLYLVFAVILPLCAICALLHGRKWKTRFASSKVAPEDASPMALKLWDLEKAPTMLSAFKSGSLSKASLCTTPDYKTNDRGSVKIMDSTLKNGKVLAELSLSLPQLLGRMSGKQYDDHVKSIPKEESSPQTWRMRSRIAELCEPSPSSEASTLRMKDRILKVPDNNACLEKKAELEPSDQVLQTVPSLPCQMTSSDDLAGADVTVHEEVTLASEMPQSSSHDCATGKSLKELLKARPPTWRNAKGCGVHEVEKPRNSPTDDDVGFAYDDFIQVPDAQTELIAHKDVPELCGSSKDSSAIVDACFAYDDLTAAPQKDKEPTASADFRTDFMYDRVTNVPQVEEIFAFDDLVANTTDDGQRTVWDVWFARGPAQLGSRTTHSNAPAGTTTGVPFAHTASTSRLPRQVPHFRGPLHQLRNAAQMQCTPQPPNVDASKQPVPPPPPPEPPQLPEIHPSETAMEACRGVTSTLPQPPCSLPSPPVPPVARSKVQAPIREE
eukprot:gnl/MRDRNA2_/MRDRNA2_27989_c0_seq2.p1 gnl/MRDRNA2_/MRDRNA2_27989_c0~~gnl/MRDRNA2_/MRDRNA2_27989_c0_seq2.p1  ORF type:complete len:705 (-),score=124.78 gnl/MRDRNA2_/MRDRNA2_27989_c0_seq2:34-2028(-)